MFFPNPDSTVTDQYFATWVYGIDPSFFFKHYLDFQHHLKRCVPFNGFAVRIFRGAYRTKTGDEFACRVVVVRRSQASASAA